jgi:hypothetical protein
MTPGLRRTGYRQRELFTLSIIARLEPVAIGQFAVRQEVTAPTERQSYSI